MNTISPISTNYSQYNRNNQIKQNITFKGALGDQFIKKITSGAEVKPAEVIKEIKGTFGLKSEKAEDIIESFIGSVKELFNDKKLLSEKLQESESKISILTSEKAALERTEDKLRWSLDESDRIRAIHLGEKDKELAEMKTQLEKYQAVAKIKSVEELDTVMPDKAIEVFDEMIKHKTDARKSMSEFLFSGKGQEEALAQIERNNVIMKAHRDEIINIPEVAKKNKELNTAGEYYSTDSNYTLNLIENALECSPKGDYLRSPAIKQQVKDNAMAILTPMADERYSNTGVNAISKDLDKRLTDVEKFRDGFSKGVEKLKKKYGAENIELKPVEYDARNSKIIITEDGNTFETTYYNTADYGNSNWD